MVWTNFFSMAYIQRRSTKHLDTGCMEWNGRLDKDGYGQFKCFSKDKWHKAHRIAFKAARGEIPVGYEIAHLCHNKSCVNPEHLTACSHIENVRMTLSKAGGVWERARNAAQAAIKHNKKGHSIFAVARQMNVNRKLVAQLIRGER